MESFENKNNFDVFTGAILDLSSEAIIFTDSDFFITGWNDNAKIIFDLSKTASPKIHLSETGLPEISSFKNIRNNYNKDEQIKLFIIRNKAGRTFLLTASYSAIKDRNNNITNYVFCLNDKSYHYKNINSCRIWESIYTNSNEGIIITGYDNKIISVNHSFEQITGFKSEEVLGKTPTILSSGYHNKEFYKEMWSRIIRVGLWRGEIYNRRKNGEVFLQWLTINTLKDEDGNIQNYIAIFSDISSFKEKETKIHFLDYYDNLTGLPNRILMENKLQRALFDARRSESMVALLFFNLDNFKKMNNELGHAKGDLLIVETARRLVKCVSESDTVARFNGDEFILILKIKEKNEVFPTIEKIINAIRSHYILDSESISLTPCMGVSMYPDDAYNMEYLIKNANTAMNYSKTVPGKYYQFYNNQIHETLQSRIKMEKFLSQAIRNDEFFLEYQPKYNLRSGAAVGAEVLLRWSNPELGLISPDEFIPLAEESGLILEIGDWVLTTAMKQIGEWLQKDKQMLRYNISINVSPKQLDNQFFIEKLEKLLIRNKLAAQMIALEITETTFMHNINDTFNVLSRLRELDIKICVDDFGTGYSSLNYLKKLPITSLKIDRTFIQDIPADNNSTSITEAIIEMAHKLEMITVAEGVETIEQAEFLLNSDCDMAQGFFYSRPLHPDDFFKFIKKYGALI